jgi:hypothetical protein
MNEYAGRARFGDTGSSSVTMAIIFPAVAVLVLTFAQAALVATARNVALASAEEGLRIARTHGGTLTQGRAAAVNFAAREPVLDAPTVAISGSDTIEVRVRGRAPAILPGVRLSINEVARGPRERFVPESRGFTNSEGSSGANPRVVTPGG